MTRELTAQDVHEAAFIAYAERYANYPGAFPKGMSWEKLNDKERIAYARMAELLNSKLEQPERVEGQG
jgi:hypothetical protein